MGAGETQRTLLEFGWQFFSEVECSYFDWQGHIVPAAVLFSSLMFFLFVSFCGRTYRHHIHELDVYRR